MGNLNLAYALRVSGRTFAEDAREAGTVTLLGMVAIFAVLALLWLVIEILHNALNRETAKKPVVKLEKKPQKQAAPEEKPTLGTRAFGKPAPDNGALVAAITAAISAAMADEGYTGGFRVVSFKRSSNRKSGRN